MEQKLVDSIYNVLKIKLNSQKKTYTHSEIVENTKNVALAVFDIDEPDIIDFVVTKYEENHPNICVHEPDVLLNDDTSGKWFERKKEILQHSLIDGYVKRYENYLRREDFDESVIEQMELDCEKILKQCANPEMTMNVNERKKRGLVVGDVQSGKTANYLALINMACDYGYKTIVLLAGMTDSLRQQTQFRVDEGFIGAISDSIGAAAISDEDGQLHPTAAGMLMFGDEYNIVRHFPEYFLDYREELDPTTRWSDRLQSSSGEWSGNVCDFYFRVYNKIIKDVKVPFKMSGGERVDDTPVHKALREALANCLINADYHGLRGVVIRKEPDKLILANPGYVRTGKKQMRIGGESDPRNKALMKMFNLINIGERAGSGVPNIFNVWEDEGWEEPVIEERFDPDRTVLTLSFVKKDKKESNFLNKKASELKSEPVVKIMDYLEHNNEITTAKGMEITGKSEAQVRRYLKGLCNIGVIRSTKATKGNIYVKNI